MLIRVLAALAAAIIAGGACVAAAAGLILPVPTVTIYPGDVIDGSMVEERAVRAAGVGRQMTVQDRGGLIGKTARRTLLPGQPVAANAIETPPLVACGAAVAIVFEEGGLTILAQAKSLEAGSPGDIVRVRNLDSGIMVNAVVQADGTVRVGQL